MMLYYFSKNSNNEANNCHLIDKIIFGLPEEETTLTIVGKSPQVGHTILYSDLPSI
jgi:hypothetical protein